MTEIGKHWSIKVDFDEGPRTILGTFLTLRDVSEDIPDEKIEDTQEDVEAYQRPSEEEETETEEDKPEDSEEETEAEEDKPTEEEPETEVLETVMAEAVVEEPVDHGDYEPGIMVSHAIFGVGEVKDSKPKGENYRLDIDFEDGSKTLLSTFVEIVSDDSTEDDDINDGDDENEVVEAEAIAVEAEAVVAEPVEEVVEAEAVVAEPVEEAIIDLSKPEVQDAEIVDEDD
jgi:hypothetical protein